MTCYHPLKGYRSKTLTATGKRGFVVDRKLALLDCPMQIPCGQCIGCRLERSRQWAVRISHEASLYDQNCFITLTYSPEFLPSDGSLNVRHFQLFLKRLRKKYGKNIRFFHCGEYGDNLGRPHYHATLLNFDFPDKKLHRKSDRGDHIYRSASLEELWPFGLSEIGAVTFESAAYVARYCLKKKTGKLAADHYTRLDPSSGEIFELKPEYTTMSRKPGIGAPWLQKFSTDVYPHDAVVIRGGMKVPPPRYYNKQYEVLYPDKYREIRRKRLVNSRALIKSNPLEYDYERLTVKETVKSMTVNSTLKRK
ncbi:MAG: replication initiator protein [Microvirus sp.]|nr:MAG: replication initiator protein [Microvirus sp.]